MGNKQRTKNLKYKFIEGRDSKELDKAVDFFLESMAANNGEINWEIISMTSTQNGVMVCLGKVYAETVIRESSDYPQL